jgi:UDP-glucose 4-epimerase
MVDNKIEAGKSAHLHKMLGRKRMILVTGGAGYIGSHTCIELIELGREILVVDNLINSTLQAISRIEEITGKSVAFMEGDVRDESFLCDIFDQFKIESVIHFAGLKSVGESNHYPLKYFDNNISGILTLLKVMGVNGCKNLVFSSSATVYGSPSTLPVVETAPLLSLNPYGRSKLIIEKILEDLHSADGLWNIAILRYFNPVGAHHTGLNGELPNNTPENLFPIISEVAVGLREVVDIYGGDYPTIDGTGVRDYIHVMDLARGHISALEMFCEEGCIFAVNLGTGKGHSVLEIIREFERASGRKVPYKIVERRAGDSASCYADVTHAKTLMGWSSKISLTQMCEDQWRWQSHRLSEKVSN